MSDRKERRQSRRVDTRLDLALQALDGTMVAGHALNLSAGGAYLVVERRLASLSKLEVSLELPAFADREGARRGPHRFVTEAIVVRCERTGEGGDFRVGIAFMNMRPEDRRKLEDYIDWRLTRSLLERAEAAPGEGD